MKLSTYYPDSGQFESESGKNYDCRLKKDDHVLLVVALSRLAEGKYDLQETYESITTNYNLECVKFEELK